MFVEFRTSRVEPVNCDEDIKKYSSAICLRIFSTCIKMIFLTFFLSTVISPIAFGQPVPIPQRQDLFVRAYKSMAFFTYMAEKDPSFTKNLTDSERQILQEIHKVAMENATLNWLNENGVERFTLSGHFVYAYTITKNRIVKLATQLERPFGLQFSADQKLFDLDPNQPIRDAMTETDPEKDIFVNTARVNRAGLSLDLPAAVSILFHEFGHKLGLTKIQPAIDSLAAKLEDHLRSLITSTDVNGKTVNLLRFKIMPGYDQWIENILFGEYRGVNQPSQIHPFTSFDKQGIYIWIDDHGIVTDLSDRITSEIRKNAIVQYEDQPAFDFVRHNIVMAAGLSVGSVSKDRFTISLNSNLLQVVVPFMKSNSYEPSSYQLYERAFTQMDPHYGAFFNFEYTLSSTNYQVRKVRVLPKIFDRPQFDVEFVSKKLVGSDIEIYFIIKGDRSTNIQNLETTSEFWPELKLKIGDSEVLTKATSYNEQTGEFKFVVKDFNRIENTKVVITGMQFRLKDQLLVVPETDLTARLFLSNEIVLSEGAATEESSPPKLKSVRTWNGRKWSPLKHKSKIEEGSRLVFVFDSTEPLRELNLEQNYSVVKETTTSFLGNLIPSVGRISQSYQRTIRFESHDMIQTVVGNQLHVEINIDHNLATRLKIQRPILMDPSGLATGGPLSKSGLIENNAFNVEKNRALIGISFVSQSGLSSGFNFNHPLRFQKSMDDNDEETSSVNPNIQKCIGLFIN
jgi:hypothetical protein